MAAIKGIPESEWEYPYIRCVTRTSKSEYFITQSISRKQARFTLWKPTSSGYVKDGTADAPTELYPKIPWQE